MKSESPEEDGSRQLLLFYQILNGEVVHSGQIDKALPSPYCVKVGFGAPWISKGSSKQIHREED